MHKVFCYITIYLQGCTKITLGIDCLSAITWWIVRFGNNFGRREVANILFADINTRVVQLPMLTQRRHSAYWVTTFSAPKHSARIHVLPSVGGLWNKSRNFLIHLCICAAASVSLQRPPMLQKGASKELRLCWSLSYWIHHDNLLCPSKCNSLTFFLLQIIVVQFYSVLSW